MAATVSPGGPFMACESAIAGPPGQIVAAIVGPPLSPVADQLWHQPQTDRVYIIDVRRPWIIATKNLLLLFLASNVAYFNFRCLICYSYVNFITAKTRHQPRIISIFYIISKNIPNNIVNTLDLPSCK